MNIVLMNPESSCYMLMVAHVTQLWKALLGSTLSNLVPFYTTSGHPRTGAQANVGTLYVQFSTDVGFFCPCQEQTGRTLTSFHISHRFMGIWCLWQVRQTDNSCVWDALHLEIGVSIVHMTHSNFHIWGKEELKVIACLARPQQLTTRSTEWPPLQMLQVWRPVHRSIPHLIFQIQARH